MSIHTPERSALEQYFLSLSETKVIIITVSSILLLASFFFVGVSFFKHSSWKKEILQHENWREAQVVETSSGKLYYLTDATNHIYVPIEKRLPLLTEEDLSFWKKSLWDLLQPNVENYEPSRNYYFRLDGWQVGTAGHRGINWITKTKPLKKELSELCHAAGYPNCPKT